jgi:hypothetical protein
MRREDLPIPVPCHEDWNTMTVEGKTLFCAACKKNVKDMVRMTEAEARELLAQPDQRELCVRYLYDAHGRLMFDWVDTTLVPVTNLVRPSSRAKSLSRVLAAGAVAVGLSSIMACGGPSSGQVVMGIVACPPGGPGAPQPYVAPTSPGEDAGSVPSSSVAPTPAPPAPGTPESSGGAK